MHSPNPTIRAEMARRNVTQTDLGKHLELTQAAVSARLTGRIDWKLRELQAVAELLGVPLVELVASSPDAVAAS